MFPLWGIVEIAKRIIKQPFGPGWWNATKGKETEYISPGEQASIIQEQPKSTAEKKDDTKLVLAILAGIIFFLVVLMIIASS